MKKCNAIIRNGTRCSKPKLWGSRYCWWHQDYVVILAIIAILIPVFIFSFQERHPSLDVKYDVLKNGNPCALTCIVSNTGRKEARDAIMSFNNMLPVQTKVFAKPELGITLIESEILPNPRLYPELAKNQKAFAIKIPRIAPRDTIIFQIRTIDNDNERAGNQIIRIHKEIISILNDFGDRLARYHPDEAIKWDINSVINARIKEENLFSPAKLYYEKGRKDIEYFTEKEKEAQAINQDLYIRFKKEFIDIYKERPKFKAPVIRIKTSNAESTYAIFPPYLDTYLDVTVSLKELKQKGEMAVYPPVPDSY